MISSKLIDYDYNKNCTSLYMLFCKGIADVCLYTIIHKI